MTSQPESSRRLVYEALSRAFRSLAGFIGTAGRGNLCHWPCCLRVGCGYPGGLTGGAAAPEGEAGEQPEGEEECRAERGQAGRLGERVLSMLSVLESAY
jgi:hypothetical protein